MDASTVNKVLFSHRTLCIARFLVALPLYILALSIRLLLTPFSLIGLMLKRIGAFSYDEKNIRLLKELAPLFSLLSIAFLCLEAFPSYVSAFFYYQIINLPRVFKGRGLREALSGRKKFILFLRDFKPTESSTMHYRPILGTIRMLSHRDEYLFTGNDLGVTRQSVVAIGNPGDHTPTYEAISFLFVRNAEWRFVAKHLMQEASLIILTVPSSGTLHQLLHSPSISHAQQTMLGYWAMFNMGYEEKPGLATEIDVVLKDQQMYNKTLLVNAFLDGQPYITSTWFSLKQLRTIETNEVNELLKEVL